MIIELYSRRKRRTEETDPDVYQYDSIPEPLRTQVRFIMEDAIGPYWASGAVVMHVPPHNNEAWEFIRHAVCREKGRVTLANESNPYKDCVSYLHKEQSVDDWLDLVELAFLYIHVELRQLRSHYDREQKAIKQEAQEAIDELNHRFREAAFGYRFENGQIIRVDSELIHTEVIKPALTLLSDPRFAGPQDEYLSAHAHYRASEYKDAITDALNAFESTMKAICDIKAWEYPKRARASDLMKVLRRNGLLPDYLDTSFDQLIGTLSSGLPKVRNEEGSHGQGAEPKKTPDYVAAYALHLAAANIVLLVEAFRANGKR